ncbi:MAG: outer membrane protein assembly factor BamD [Candidatus Angelobacter sp. Gp1-AA117]|nr:MAG: outer membrane protein assembly factor BamD [Candidatus Angelobacter sp. Gp1-AA117]
MLRKLVFSTVLAAALMLAGCHHSKVQNPIANIDSKQPDKVLYDRSMDAMKHGKYTVARTLLETLINTYPDSEYIARAKLSLGDSWYAEGGTAAMQQAEAQYKDFITFFPNLPEAAEAQLKVANIHYKQMEKPDRDYHQAMRAEEEYQSLIQQFPDSKLVPEATQRLREVQEVLAERQFRIAHFYYLRDNLVATQARLKSLTDSYPLYSSIDEALLTLGSIYERQAAAVKQQKNVAEARKEKVVAEYENDAIEAYSKILTRYPAMKGADEAKKRLTAMKAPVPTPTAEALAQSKAEEDSRLDTSKFHGLMTNFHKHPDMAKAAKAGDPSMDPETMASAPAMMQHLTQALAGQPTPPAEGTQATQGSQGNQKLGVENVTVGTGPAPTGNQAPPGSQTQTPGKTDAATPPERVNDIQTTSGSSTAGGSEATANSGAQSGQGQQNANSNSTSNDKQQDSTSKKKGKKGLRKLIPF